MTARRRALAAALSVIAAAGLTACSAASSSTTPATPELRKADLGAPVRVVSVADGDTLAVDQNGRRVTVRLIGVDTPETKRPDTPVQCWGPQASEYTHGRADNKIVRLETDPTQDRVDRYGRTLAYVWLPSGSMLNYELLEYGHAREYTYRHRDYRYAAQFRTAATEARDAHRGLWATCP
ncbi:MAG: thermonuclease family protein [Gordonia polyisoprenivorans]|nr:thermonuclease family protein [Gordonia polyisoprenivorans]